MKEHRFCVDRVEGDVAVLIDETGHAYHLPVSSLPNATGERHVVYGVLNNGIPTALHPGTGIDPVQQKIAALHHKLFTANEQNRSDDQKRQP